jgi:hypothetical protein
MALAGHCPAVLVPPVPELPELLGALVAPPLPLVLPLLVLPLPVVPVEPPPLPFPALLVPEPPVPVPFDGPDPGLHATPAGTSTVTRATRKKDEGRRNVMVSHTMLAQSVLLEVHFV